MAEDGGLLTDDVKDMAADALFDELPTVKAKHLRNAPRKLEGRMVDDWQQVNVWEGRLRQKRTPIEQKVGEQTREVQAWEFVMRPYGAGAQEWRKITAADRLVIGDQLFSVEGTASPSMLVQSIQLTAVEASNKDTGA